jgi:uncharacterized protein YndB with AHSA1/START domain
MRCHVIRNEATTTIRRPINEVFGYATDPTNEPTWHTDAAEARLRGSGPVGVASQIDYSFGLSGGGGKAVGEVTAFEPGHLEKIRFSRGPMGMKPTITLRFEAAGDSTRFTRAVEIETSGLTRLLERPIAALVGRRNATFVENLRRRLEGG